jgi:hypothetical protein
MRSMKTSECNDLYTHTLTLIQAHDRIVFRVKQSAVQMCTMLYSASAPHSPKEVHMRWVLFKAAHIVTITTRSPPILTSTVFAVVDTIIQC